MIVYNFRLDAGDDDSESGSGGKGAETANPHDDPSQEVYHVGL